MNDDAERRPNVLLITLDQLRADCLSAAGHPVVRTPALDHLAANGVRFTRHHGQAAPCAPGRASLYTGTYQMNHRVVANGTPLDARFDNVAKAARRAGYDPVLFGYTDQAVDPRETSGPDDPRMQHYAGILPGFRAELHLPDDHLAWLTHLTELGHTGIDDAHHALRTEPARPAEHSVSAFLTDRAITWMRGQPGDRAWFAHLSYLRPHPPHAAAGEFAHRYAPSDLPLPLDPATERHWLHEVLLGHPDAAAPIDPDAMRSLLSQYYGMISEVDAQLARVWQTLRDTGAWERTLVIVTADHGELAGDHGLIGKVAWFEQSYAIPCIVRDPRHPGAHGTVVDAFTESVDVFPTLCEAMGVAIPAQCDGLPLTPFLQGAEPPWWRDATYWEFDWRDAFLAGTRHRVDDDGWPWDRTLEHQHLAARLDDHTLAVQFGDGSWRCFDLDADPTGRTALADPARELQAAQQMLVWRTRHADRTHTHMLVRDGGVGRFPDPPTPVGTPAP